MEFSNYLKIKNYKIKNCLLDILFPKKCVGCGKQGKYVCEKCELYIVDALQLPGFTALWEYNGIIKELIHRIKFNGEYDIIKELVGKKDFEIAEDATITYVPMHIKKQKKRGFNQAEIIAREIGKKVNRPVVKMLERTKKTSDQAKLDKTARLENVRNAFQICVKPGFTQNVLLIDDVYTSGATMQECSKVLRKSGINNISYFTLARTV